ncbi:unconventional myosin-IXb [Chanos chanos]|uniref:Unconventional myosin-IXb n=1 Tax=Chanos chanos TaxID=29144 RepID=A0A6J2VAZ0_CHACN|nr:unconventional myosin-IXb-like [Chanos chanos]
MSVSVGEGTANYNDRSHVLQIYPRVSQETAPCCTLRVPAGETVATVIQNAGATLGLDMSKNYTLVEVRECGGEEWVLQANDLPVHRVLQWPKKAQDLHPQSEGYFFALQEDNIEGSIDYDRLVAMCQEREAQGLVDRGFLAPQNKDCSDLCNLPVLTEESILDTLRYRFHKHKIYTFAGNILITVNPFKFLPIYNPKYVKMYNNHTLGKLEPHIFAIADAAFHTMLNKHVNQCIVISGESGSGKTQSTNFLIHCLTALSQKSYTSGVETTILGAGPVLEAFGNAKTAYNNNSSRFGKFIQVNYLESGVVRGAVVEKYLLEKSRLVSREKSERNYHVFYYLLVGASEEEQAEFKLLQPEDYHYLREVRNCIYTLRNSHHAISQGFNSVENFHLVDEEEIKHEFKRLHQAMEMVGFLPATKKQIFSVLSAILYLGNVTYKLKEDGEGVEVGPADVLSTLSDLLKVKEELLVEALTKRRAMTANDTLILPYSLNEAITARDSMAKSLYSALFDWIVLRINHALLNRKDMEESVPCLSIGVLDIFGFENFVTNSFEQFCINYANEQLQYYCNQYIFKLEQEEYQAEGIIWDTIAYTDNIGCIHLISKKPTGLFHLLDEESNLPRATDATVLEKFKQQHQGNAFFVPTQVLEPAFVIRHFAGKVKYQIKDFRAKNTDHMRPDIVALLRSSEWGYLRQLIGTDPVAVFRWGILRATIRTLAAFNQAGRRWAAKHPDKVKRYSRRSLQDLRRPSSHLERMKSQTSLIEFSFDHSEEYPIEVFEDIFATFENKKEMHAKVLQSIKQLGGEVPQKLRLSTISLRKSRLFFQKQRSNRHKQIIPKNLISSRSLKLIADVTMHNRTTRSLLHPHKKKKPPSISAQFQASLSKLLDTLRKAEPFFVRCIRSNSEKREMYFDEDLVQRQLRYTGMLETVQIRRSGYGAKYTFKEFTDQFRVLLPKQRTTPQEDITNLLRKMGLGKTSFQIGKTKVFLKEVERQRLQETLHREVMRGIITLQRWFRACLTRKHYLCKREAAIVIQRAWRGFHNEKCYRAATLIQKVWRESHQRAEYLRQRESLKKMQRLVRGKTPDQRRPQSFSGKVQVAIENKNGDSSSDIDQEKQDGGDKPKKHHTTESEEKKELRHQFSHESKQQDNRHIVSESTEEPAPKVNGEDQVSTKAKDEQNLKDTEGKEQEGSKPCSSPLIRPFSVPLDTSPEGGYSTGSLQRYMKTSTMRQKAERWRERRSEGAFLDRGSPVIQRPTDLRLKDLQKHGFSISLDNVSKLSSSESDSSSASPSSSEVRQQPDGCLSPPKSPGESSRVQQPPPERIGFLSKILKRRVSPQVGNVTMAKTLTEKGEQAAATRSYHSSTLPVRVQRNPTIKISRATRCKEQWNSSLEREITDANELRHLDEFLGNQMNELRTRMKELSETECIFFSATTEFRNDIKGMYSLPKLHIGYKDLMNGYKSKVSTQAKQKKKTEVQLVVNLFQSVLDGFIRGEIKREEAEPLKPAKKNKRRRKQDLCADSPLDHLFSTYQVNIVQSCDLCGSFIWGMEKACMCSSCKMVCHKKCLGKIITDCSTRCAMKSEDHPGTLHFGVSVSALSSKSNPVPMVLEMMLEYVEMNGLYTEGIYRKSGSACRARELHQILETDPEKAHLENYPIHTITGLIKRWLRELPDPLMTYNLYSDFLCAVELPEEAERLRAIYKKLEELPLPNFSTLERLVFHLVRVAKEEANNRMSANALAIVFAPCILRSPDASDPLSSIRDVSKTTMCIEIIINEQTRRYNDKMEEIQQLEHAHTLAVNQLKLRRQNTVFEKPTSELDPALETENLLIERIKSIRQEKDNLACRLPELDQDTSDNENMDSESSVSSDSLLEDQFTSLESEGPLYTDVKSQMPDSPCKGPDQAQSPYSQKQPAERVQQRQPTGRKAGNQSMSLIQEEEDHRDPSSQQQKPKSNRSLSDLDIPFIDEDI